MADGEMTVTDMEKQLDQSARSVRIEYQKRWREQKRKERERRHKVVNNGVILVAFCPRCGLNLEVLATALAVVNKA